MSDSTTPADYKSEPWHFKREIQVGHLITTLTVAVSAIWYLGKLEQRVALVEQRQAQQDQMLAASIVQFGARLDRFESKLDRLIENGMPDQKGPRETRR